MSFKYAAIKRSINNDNHNGDEQEYQINIFNTREDAAEWLIEQYEYRYSEDDSEKIDKKLLYTFLLTSSIDDAMFQWEWKRRGNFRTYKIIEYTDVLKFYVKTKNLYKIKNSAVKKRN